MTRRGVLTLVAVGIGLVAVVLTGVGGVGYWVFTGTPTYSLWQTRRAIDHHDLATFRKYVDVHGVSRSLVDSAFAEADRESHSKPAASDQWSAAGETFGKGLMELMKPRLAEMIEQRIEKLVETGVEQQGLDGARSPEAVHALTRGLRGIDYVRRDGEIALAGILVSDDPSDQTKTKTLELKLRHLDGYWQVAEVTNPNFSSSPAPSR